MQEQTVFDIRPSYKAYLGWIIVSALLIVVGIGIVLLPLVLLRAWMTVSSTSYRLSNERLLVRTGWLSKRVQELELYRVQDVSMEQGILQRLFGVGAVHVISADKTTPKLILKGIAQPEAIKEQVRATYRTARKAEGVRIAETNL